MSIVEENFLNKIKDFSLAVDEPIIIAYSGGVDSLALLLLAKTYFHNIKAIIIDHSLRKESALEAVRAKENALKIGIEAIILTVPEKKPSNENLQNWAREQRYQMLLTYAKANSINYIFTAHHKNDNVETILLNLLRGTGIKGVKGIKETSIKSGVNIVRPLLYFSKQDLASFVEKKGLIPVEDPTNKKTDYKRNFLRQLINSQSNKAEVENRIINLANNLKKADEALDIETEKYFEQICSPLPNITFNIDKYRQLSEEIKFRLILLIFKKLVNLEKFRAEKIVNLIGYLCDSNKKVKNYSLYGCVINKNKDLSSFSIKNKTPA